MIKSAGTGIEHDPGTSFPGPAASRPGLYALQVATAKAARHQAITPDRPSGRQATGPRETPVDGAHGEAVAANIDETAEHKRRISEAAHLVANRSAGLNERLA
jgi:hypothetical protein